MELSALLFIYDYYYFMGGSTIKDLLVHPKDKDTILQESGVIYKYKCGRVDYTGESGRTFEERFREHMRAPSPIHDHHNTTGHDLSIENFSIVGREDQSITRYIKEAILIRFNDPISATYMGWGVGQVTRT